jgi:tetratricopeptide (TPR) repeat protein
LCHLYIYKGRYDESLTFCDKAIKVDKSFVMAYYWKSFVQQYQGRYDAALETYRTGRIYSGAGENEPLWILMQAQSHAAQKRRDEALKTLNRFLQSADFRKNPDQLPHEIALVYNLLGDRDRAFEWLARVEFNNGNSLRYISTDPRFANLHEDARFAALVEKWKSQIQPANRKN